MKKIAVGIISFYQIFLSNILSQILGIKRICCYEKTCSQYTKEKILEKGVLKGSYLGFIRLLSCHPFAKIAK